MKNEIETSVPLGAIQCTSLGKHGTKVLRSTINKYITNHLSFKSVRKARTFNIRQCNVELRSQFAMRMGARLKLGRRMRVTC